MYSYESDLRVLARGLLRRSLNRSDVRLMIELYGEADKVQ
jgi:hypothetical protein